MPMEPSSSNPPSQEDSGLSLNIVAETEEVTTENVSKKKRKRLNKYERRRRKAAAAKARKEDDSTEERGDTEIKEDDSRGEEQKAEFPVQIAEKEKGTAAKEKVSESINDVTSTNQKLDTTEDTPSPKNIEPCKDNDKDEPPPAGKSPEEEAEHAAYMAEYHARPLELDRRSGAKVQKIRPIRNAHQTSEVFADKTKWKDLKIDDKIVQLLPHSRPTKIQERVLQSWQHTPHKNQWIQSETGSGKTLAYFLPVLQNLWQTLQTSSTKDRASLGTRCLIICPTQELVQQTQQACEQLVTKLCAGQLVVGNLRGQASRSKEKARIRKGLAILVTTPGRLLDHLQTTVALQTAILQLEWLVLDEVDRLFDMGLAPQLKQVIELLQQFARSGWRSTLVSATVPPEVKDQVQELLSGGGKKANKEWAWIQGEKDDAGGTSSGGRSLPKQLVQYHILVSAKLRLTTLVAFLADRVQNKERTVVFMSTCASVDYYHELFQQVDCILKRGGNNHSSSKGLFGSACAVDRLHGNVPHQQRQSVLQSFTQPTTTSNIKQARILLATDVAARGLNLHADWTVQYDPPCELSDYIHRAGRVARAGQMGQSLLFLLPSEKSLLGILQLKQQSDKEMPALSLTSTLQQAAKVCPDLTHSGLQRNGMRSKTASAGKEVSSESSSRNNGSRHGEAFCSELQYRLEECVLEQSKASEDSVPSSGKKKKKKAREKDAPATLLDMARAAFLSHMRAYPTKEKLVRHIFGARALHLGHIAKSFALREAPKTLVKNSKGAGGPPGKKKKRNATLAFGKATNNGIDSDDELARNGKTAAQKRAMLMANAAKLQMGGADDF